MSALEKYREDLRRDGFLVLKKFYDVDRELRPIWQGIRGIVELVSRKRAVRATFDSNLDAMTRGYQAIIEADRSWGGNIYDAVKQIPEFMTLVASPRNAELFSELRPGSMPGLAANGYGIRIDNPNEEKFRADWHQEFPAQLRSLDGLVFWSPLLPVSPEMGPVEIAAGSHREGLIPVYSDPGAAAQQGAYALRLQNLDNRLKQYRCVSPLSDPGDLIILDFLTIHRSGKNVSNRPRWSMQFRYFNFADPLGIDIDWRGSFGAGEDFSKVVPGLKSDKG